MRLSRGIMKMSRNGSLSAEIDTYSQSLDGSWMQTLETAVVHVRYTKVAPATKETVRNIRVSVLSGCP